MVKFSIVGDWLVQQVNTCTCWGGDLHYGHEPGCGYEPLVKVEELRASGIALSELPDSPSEYWGAAHQPQWNHYPFTRVDGNEVEIGARAEDVFRVNVTEAKVFAADVLAAVSFIEASQ